MKTLIELILLFAIVKYSLKASHARGFKTVMYYALGAGIWAMICYPFIITQPVNIADTLLANREWIANAAVLTTVEAIAGIMLSASLLENYFAPKNKRKKTLSFLKVMPGLLFLLAIPYFELMFFKWRVTGDFLTTALIYTTIVITSITVISYSLKFLAKGESIKLELKMLLNMIVLIVGLLVNSAVADYNLSSAKIHVEWEPLVALMIFISFMFFIGYKLLPKIKLKNK